MNLQVWGTESLKKKTTRTSKSATITQLQCETTFHPAAKKPRLRPWDYLTMLVTAWQGLMQLVV